MRLCPRLSSWNKVPLKLKAVGINTPPVEGRPMRHFLGYVPHPIPMLFEPTMYSHMLPVPLSTSTSVGKGQPNRPHEAYIRPNKRNMIT